MRGGPLNTTGDRRARRMGAALSLALVILAWVAAASAQGTKAATCRGSLHSPGVVSGNYASGLKINGTCKVSAGLATVHGILTLRPHSVLLAAYGLDSRTHTGSSRLVVDGNVEMKRGSTLILGCEYSHLNCLDQSPSGPELTSSSDISGTLTASGALAIVIHTSTVHGAVRQIGGGGGLKCPTPGVWKQIGFPVYSDYEDSSFARSLTISHVRSCYLGLARDHVGRNLTVTHNSFHDDDAIEILSSLIGGNLSCSHDSHVWDDHETSQSSLFPRKPEPNTVHGKRSGQCRLASPTQKGGKPGPGAF